MGEHILTDELAAVIAHEIKNPLAMIKANLQTIEAADTEGLHERNYRMMQKEIEKINNMITDFLELAKTKQDSRDIVYPYDIISEIIENNETANFKAITYSLECETPDVSLFGSVANLTILFENLIKNAREAAPDNGHIIAVIRHEGSNIIITVKDDGPGILPGAETKIFNSFFTTKKEGSGLGLIICKKIVSEHGGTLTVQNSPKGGAEAVIILRASDEKPLNKQLTYPGFTMHIYQ